MPCYVSFISMSASEIGIPWVLRTPQKTPHISKRHNVFLIPNVQPNHVRTEARYIHHRKKEQIDSVYSQIAKSLLQETKPCLRFFAIS